MKLSKNLKNLYQIGSLVQYAFLKNYDVTKDPNFLERYNHSDGFGEFHNDKLTSYVMVNKFQSQLFDTKVKMAGVGYVATYPENRGHGDISRIMNEILEDLHNNHVALSNLAPWSETFYRQYGYEDAIYQKKISFCSSALRYFKPTQTGSILRSKLSNIDISSLIKNLYQNQLKSGDERNTLIREDWWWQRFNTYYPNRYAAVYLNNENIPKGYMFYKIEDNNFIVDEIYFQTRLAAINLLNFMGSHISSCGQFEINVPAESKLEYLFPAQEELNVTTRLYMMSRIIDFEEIISCIKCNLATPICIEVTNDQQCTWNNGKWLINTASDNDTICERTTNKPDYSGSITAWTQVLIGALTIDEAVTLGTIKHLTKKDISFTKGTVSFYDYF